MLELLLTDPVNPRSVAFQLDRLREDLAARIHRDFRYASGSSDVAARVPELPERGEGVCQDFAHLAVAGLRAMGLAARYVSGYLETQAPPGRERLVGTDASHALGLGGHPRRLAGPRPDQRPHRRRLYVELAHGRDYADVPPLKGVIVSGATESVMEVAVDMVRLPIN